MNASTATTTKPLNERQVPDCPLPATFYPPDHEVFDEHNDGVEESVRPNVAFIRNHLYNEGRLKESQVIRIIQAATDILAKERNLIDIEGPVTICGDVHGQYYDMLKLLEIGGSWTENKYLFLGDYVDRGEFGIECLLLLYSIKIRFPNRIFLLRGNHESRNMTSYFTFEHECQRKYSQAVYDSCMVSFDALPLAAVVEKHFFCVHGGISPQLSLLSDIDALDRFQEPPGWGLMCDLLWSDPIGIKQFGREAYPSPQGLGYSASTCFVDNPQRGCSYMYTYAGVCKFLENNDLKGMIRAHEPQELGFSMFSKRKGFPTVISIFSAPNYVDHYQNKAAVLFYANNNITMRQFTHSPHPPPYIDAFTLSLPFIGAKVIQMLLAILRVCSVEELEPHEGARARGERPLPRDVADQQEHMKRSIMTAGRAARVFQALREDAEQRSRLGSEESDADSQSMTGQNKPTRQRRIPAFEDVRKSDMLNEAAPPSMRRLEIVRSTPSGSQLPPGRDASLAESSGGANADDSVSEKDLEDIADRLAGTL